MDKSESKVRILLTFLLSLATNKFTGSIEIHFNEGNVGKIYKHGQVKLT
jgi:hypothetical protein